MHWYVAEVSVNREAMVAFTLRCIDMEPFLPLELDTQRISHRTKRRELATRLWTPGYIFFRTTVDRLPDAMAVRDLNHVLTTPDGEVLRASEAQMARFIREHDAMIEAEKASYHRGQLRARQKKAKWQKPSREVFAQYMEENFGVRLRDAA